MATVAPLKHANLAAQRKTELQIPSSLTRRAG